MYNFHNLYFAIFVVFVFLFFCIFVYSVYTMYCIIYRIMYRIATDSIKLIDRERLHIYIIYSARMSCRHSVLSPTSSSAPHAAPPPSVGSGDPRVRKLFDSTDSIDAIRLIRWSRFDRYLQITEYIMYIYISVYIYIFIYMCIYIYIFICPYIQNIHIYIYTNYNTI